MHTIVKGQITKQIIYLSLSRISLVAWLICTSKTAGKEPDADMSMMYVWCVRVSRDSLLVRITLVVMFSFHFILFVGRDRRD